MTAPVDTVRRFYDALGRGDVRAVLSLLDAQIKWTEAERSPYYSGTWHGPQAVLDNLLVPLSGDWDGFSAKAHGVHSRGWPRRLARNLFRHVQENRTIIFGRLRSRLDGLMPAQAADSCCAPEPYTPADPWR